MDLLLPLPHPIWLRRLSIGLALALVALGASIVAGWTFEIAELAQWSGDGPPVPVTIALGFVAFGLILLAIEWGYRRVAWLALLPGALGLLTLIGGGISPSEVRPWLPGARMQIGAGGSWGITTITIACFLLGSLTLSWLAWPKWARYRTLGIAFGGSAIISVGFSTLLGYALNLPAVYRWGTGSSLPAATAVMLVLLGGAILALAWREHQAGQPGAPAWLPMPVVVAFTTLTLILWTGLREREFAYLGTSTQIMMNGLASGINLELERQSSALERTARRWGQASELSQTVWEVDAKAFFDDAPGCTSVTWIGSDRRTKWVYPQRGNEAQASFDHASQPVRLAALDAATASSSAVVSASLRLPGTGTGFVIYVPVYENGQLAGYVGAEFGYRRFLAAIDRRLKLNNTYRVAVFIGGDPVFQSPSIVAGSERNKLESMFNIFDRRLRIEMSPSEENLRRNRRYLPELALAAGFGITILLGLSVHLARTARTGLRASRLSNTKLLAENEERRRVEEMLKVSDERLRLALDSTQIGISEWNLPANQLFYSAGLWNMLGYVPGTIATTPEAWTSLIHPDDLAGYRAAIERQLSGAVSFIEPEYRVRAASGEWRWLYARSRTVSRSAGGAPLRIIGTLQDITARKEAEQALRESQAAARKLSLVASRTDNLVLIAKPDGTIEWVNESFERVMEYSLAEVVGKNPASFMIGPETNLRIIRRIRASMNKGEGISTDVVNYSKSGRKYHLHLEIQPVRNDAGVLENFIAIQADISARVETEHNLRRAKVEADAASRAKSEFLASMSHEIRTPMNGVIGMTSLLLDTPLNHDQRDFVGTIRTSGEALLTIINDILDFSKIESGKMELEQLPFDLSVCLEDALDLFSVSAAGKKIDLAYHIEDDVPAWILGDVTRLRQVLVNLINNAVKFTPAGRISIVARRVHAVNAMPGESPPLTLEFSVNDSGIGIPPDRMNRLFQPFSQVDSSTTRKYGGTGLGLAICQRLCGLMGGSISATSTVGEGSSFVFTIQTEEVSTPPGWGLPEMPVKLNYGPVLCLNGNPVTQLRLQTFFRTWGAQATCAASLEAAREFLNGALKPVAVVVDLELLETPAGQSFQEQIFQDELPTLVLLPCGQTAPAALAARPLVATATKPLRTPSLVRGMQSIFNARPESMPPFATADSRLLAHDIPLNILLVEDNAVNQKVALRFLDRLGYRADAVANGLEALNTLESRRYDLVFMDLQMPEMDGFEASRQIRRRISAAEQPKIVALTANALQGDRDLCLAAGMDDYIAKPVKLHEIAEAIRRQFNAGSRMPA